MAQSAAGKSHNLKVASSILSCRTFCHGYILEAKSQNQPKATVLFRNAAAQNTVALDNSVTPECRINLQGSNNFTDAP